MNGDELGDVFVHGTIGDIADDDADDVTDDKAEDGAPQDLVGRKIGPQSCEYGDGECRESKAAADGPDGES